MSDILLGLLRGGIVVSISSPSIIYTTNWESVWLSTLSDALACGGVKEDVWVIGGVLSLYNAIQF